jgi:Fe-S-cluster-containing dehydrogenase component
VLAADLVAHRGQSLVAVGPRQRPEVHALAHQLNAMLENVGQTVRYLRTDDDERAGHVADITALVDAMRAGRVETLLILGGNPVYNAPADLDFAAGLKQVPTSIQIGLHRNETARLCHWHVPQAHFLESWGDARAFDGTYSVVQPMIAPLYGGRTWIELLARILGQTLPDGQELVRATFAALTGEPFDEQRWLRTVRDGLLADSRWPEEPVSAAAVDSPGSEPLGPSTAGPWELVFCPDASLLDGRFANNGWLQECPDPMTKLTWDNAALVSPATAAALGVADESVVTLRIGDRSCRVPVCVIPGQADGSIAVSLGYGRTAAGYVGGLEERGIAPVGFDAYALRTSQAMYVVDAVDVERTTDRHPLAVTQDHHAIDTVGMQQRAKVVPQLIREASLAHYLSHPDFAQHVVHHPPLESLWQELPYEGHRWGMSIDLSKCIGCSACVVACQAENNIPVVGKEQVRRGREMHWIRVDRYFTGDADRGEEVEVALQPVACHHCELAPCEQVCPVAATVHSDEGLNDMIYNRCIGTRYCGNNCPYKVRRFNYFNYHKELEEANREVTKMMFNPDVTVRSRGVMEKCTYCVQRIQAVKIDTRNRQAPIPDGAIQTACQQACPTRAIVFGDLADESSQVARHHRADRAYAMLAELNIKPRTAYLARIRNPHPDLKSSTGGAHH